MRKRAFLLTAIALMSAGCEAAQTQPPGWQAAAAQLTAKLAQARTDRTKVPRLADPADAALLHAVFDLDGIWAMDHQDYPEIRQRCEPVRFLGRNYSSLGTVVGPDGWSITPDDRALRENWVKYHDELSLGAAALELCFAREGQAEGRVIDALPASQRTPARRTHAINVAQVTMRQFLLQIGMQTDPQMQITAANRRLMLDTLARVAPVIVNDMTLDERATVRAKIDIALPKLPAADRAAMASVRRAFESTVCTGTCALAN
jgi:hypothetical protein